MYRTNQEARRRSEEQAWLHSHAQYADSVNQTAAAAAGSSGRSIAWGSGPDSGQGLWRQRSFEPSAPVLDQRSPSGDSDDKQAIQPARPAAAAAAGARSSHSAPHRSSRAQMPKLRAADLFKPSAPALPSEDHSADRRSARRPGSAVFGFNQISGDGSSNPSFNLYQRAASSVSLTPAMATRLVAGGPVSAADEYEVGHAEPLSPARYRSASPAQALSGGVDPIARQWSSKSVGSYRPAPPAPSPWAAAGPRVHSHTGAGATITKRGAKKPSSIRKRGSDIPLQVTYRRCGGVCL